MSGFSHKYFIICCISLLVHHSVNGASLFEHLCERTRNAESTVCAYMGQVLQALYYIHSQGILYLDLKVLIRIPFFCRN